MNYDPTFDQARLDQLADQCLADNSGAGKVIFLSDDEDNRLELTSWRFEDEEAQARLMKSEFKLYLLELLDTLLVYRAQHKQPNASQGVVSVCQNQMTVQWVSRAEAERLRDL
tara:strand:- start:335 stop:673 length:339 start_codon:yes stop_codon:yes gene_type:complete